MIRRSLPNAIVVACVTLAWPSIAADHSIATGLTNTGTGLYIIAVAAALLVTLAFRATTGRLGRMISEKLGRNRLRNILTSRSTDVLSDFFLPGAYGGLTHIDHAILTSGGFFCIQSKHYNGIVFGDAEEPQWKNIDGAHCRNFLNPLIQNEGRSKALRKLLPNVPIANLVVFTGSVHFASPRKENVIYARELKAYVANFDFDPSDVEDWPAVWKTIKAAALTDEDSRKDFNAQLSFS